MLRYAMKEVKDTERKFLKCPIEDMKGLLEIIEFEIKKCKLNLDILEYHKPFWFQRKKLILYNKNHEKIEQRIVKLQNTFHKELQFLSDFYDE